MRIRTDSYRNEYKLREAIHRWDAEAFPTARAVFANSFNVAECLRRYNGIESTPLYHPPPSAERFHCDHAEGFILFPSRIANCKRHDLVLEALSKTERPVKVVFVGKGDGIEYENAVKNQPLGITYGGGLGEMSRPLHGSRTQSRLKSC
jgi:glycosyltransferase involved in cell wall biosynthesis